MRERKKKTHGNKHLGRNEEKTTVLKYNRRQFASILQKTSMYRIRSNIYDFMDKRKSKHWNETKQVQRTSVFLMNKSCEVLENTNVGYKKVFI